MTNEQRKRSVHRGVKERLVVSGELILDTAAHFGNGDSSALTDLPLLVDELDGRPLITGASLAGALRNYLRELELGYEVPLPDAKDKAAQAREKNLLSTCLFGGYRNDPYGEQSPLIVDDALGVDPGRVVTELRDGVAIDPKTGTASDEKKFDYELLPAGTRFCLRFELLRDDNKDEYGKREKALALALHGLELGEISLGARRRRGLGLCSVSQWTVTRYDLTAPAGLMAWLAADHPTWGYAGETATDTNIAPLLDVDLATDSIEDQRQTFEMEAEFAVDGSLMVRSGFGEQDRGPDYVHMHTHAPETGEPAPVLPGTSTAGAVRHRALRIAKTLEGADNASQSGAERFVECMFGPSEIRTGEQGYASRVIVSERFLKGGRSLVQSRIRIDRFTGGPAETALFEEAPHFGGRVTLNISLRKPSPAEIGLLLLVLKDLWLGDLPLGGETSVGRGRLRGLCAEIRFTGHAPIRIESNEKEGGLIIPQAEATELGAYVEELNKEKWTGGK